MMHYASIARQFKVDSAGTGKTICCPEQKAAARQTGAKSDHAA
jgi:hypothetical protein